MIQLKIRTFRIIFIVFGFITISFLSEAQQETYQDLQNALYSGNKLSGKSGPRNINWIENGDKFSYVQENEVTGNQEIRSFIPKNNEDELIFNEEGLNFPDSDKPFKYRSFQWSQDSKFLLFQCNFRKVWRNSGISDYYFYSVKDKFLKLVASDARTAELSPDGKSIGFERDGNLYIFNFETNGEIQLTDAAQANLYNGRFGWSYEEEFGLTQAWSWSHDSRYIAFWQSDEREVPVFKMTDYSGQHSDYDEVRYPKVGDANPKVKIGVINIEEKSTKWMNINLNKGYIPRIYWTAHPGRLAIVHLNRAQNELTLTIHDVDSGKGKIIMNESSDTWIDIFDFFAGVDHLFLFPKDVDNFFWISDRNGWNHIYRYDYDGNLLNQVTRGDWEVVTVEGVETKKNVIYFTSTEASPLERQLFAIDFDGKNKTRLTVTTGRHIIDFSPNGKYYVDKYSNVNTPTKVSLWSTRGKEIFKFEENTAVSEFISDHFYAPRELMKFTTDDGQELDMYVIKPIDFDPNMTYPLILNIYGGPGAQSVYNQFGTNMWEQYLAQSGYVVASVNNRGSGGYGRDFKKMVYKNLGKWESHDFVQTAQYLGEKPWIDADNIAIRGHSYGGYMASFTVLNYPGIFKLSLVGAPVTDWRLYDSIYTERYMGLLDENEEGYVKSSVTTHASKLEDKMFIAHSAMDENVHMQNTMQLLKALIDNGKDADLRIYPPGAHGVAYDGTSYILLYSQYMDYLDRYLKDNMRIKMSNR